MKNSTIQKKSTKRTPKAKSSIKNKTSNTSKSSSSPSLSSLSRASRDVDIMPELSFENLHQEINNLLKDTFYETNLFSPINLRRLSTWRPAAEVKQTEKEYQIKIQLPGVNKEDIHIDLNSDYITISAETCCEKENKREAVKFHTCEFKYGKYVRTISFDSPVKVGESKAEYKDGILSIKIPKQKMLKSQAKKLSVK